MLMGLNMDNMSHLFEQHAIDEYAARYEQLGYHVSRDCKIGDFPVDLYVEKDGVKFAFDFKARVNMNIRDELESIRHLAHEQGIHFRVVIVQVPREKYIEVEGIEDTLENWFRNSIPDVLDELSSHTMIEDVDDIVLTHVEIRNGGEMYIEGEAVIFVTLIYGKEDGDEIDDSFPFTFKGVWTYDENRELIIDSLDEYSIDTSMFYE